MSAPHDPLRASLRALADEVAPTDLFDRALHSSRRIGRREAAVGTGAALAALGLLGSGLWGLPSRPGSTPPAAAGSLPSASAGRPTSSAVTLVPSSNHTPLSPTATAQAAAPSPAALRRGYQPRVVKTTATPRSRALADLPGQVFYQKTDTRPDVVRLSPGDGRTRTVLEDAPSSVGISPDGSKIAYVADGTLLVGPTAAGDGGTLHVAQGVAAVTQAPAWSPEGDRLLIDTDQPAVLDVSSGAITPLPEGLGSGQHFRWSGDGSKLVYATSHCGLEVAGSGAATATSVPVLGEDRPADNPDGLAACKATSVDATGRRVTVPLQTTGTTGTSGATGDTADTVVDVATGEPVPLPVSGDVIGAVFHSDGNLLVRTVRPGRTKLWLFGPDNALLVQATEPTALRDLDLIAYTR
ncbi:TolB family protein [Micromonosporaceae bacterium Da 78-11]